MDSNKTLLFCSNKLPPCGFDFILDLEIVTALENYCYRRLNKRYISKRLADKKCKAIICWNKAAYLSLVNTIDCSEFKDKITIVSFGKDPSKIGRRSSKKELNLLFVCSTNNPHDFENKGGLIALDAYATLVKKFKNLQFFVRANVRKEIINKYKDVPGLVFLESYLSNEEMKELFMKSDILFEPVPGISLMLECMDYGIPAISFDFWCIPEMIIDGQSGLLVDSSGLFGRMEETKKYLENFNLGYKKLYNPKDYINCVPGFVEKGVSLINNPSELNKMRRYQRSLLTEKKKFSPELRNKKLIEIMDSALRKV